MNIKIKILNYSMLLLVVVVLELFCFCFIGVFEQAFKKAIPFYRFTIQLIQYCSAGVFETSLCNTIKLFFLVQFLQPQGENWQCRIGSLT